MLATLPWGSLGANFTDAKICQVSVSRALKSDRNSSTCFKSFFSSPRMGYDGLDVSFAFRMIFARLPVALV